MSSFTRIQLEKWIGKVGVRADKVLDVGGSQLPIRGRTRNWMVKDYKILDLPHPHQDKKRPDYEWDINREIIEKKHSSSNVLNLKDDRNTFDIIFCLEVMEYIWNPYMALRNMSNLIKKGGLLYISFSFIYPHHNPIGEDCLRYTRWGVIKLLGETDFKILNMVPRELNRKRSLLELYANEQMRPSKDFKGHDEVGYLVEAKRLYV